jgi:hypothetical protein
MADEKSNRVEVELRLLQDKNLDRLEEAFRGFEEQVERLVTEGIKVLGEAAGARTGGSTHASVASPLNWERSPSGPIGAGGYGGGPSGPGRAGGGQAPSPSGSGHGSNASIVGGRFDPTRFGFDIPTMGDYERAQFSLGQVGQGWLSASRYMSHLVQRGGQSLGAKFIQDAQGNWVLDPGSSRVSRFGRGMVRAGGAMGAVARASTYAQQGWHTIERVLPFGIAPNQMRNTADYGSSYGLSRSGILGTPYFSPAWRAGVGAKYEAFQRSRWGGGDWRRPWTMLMGDPNYSSQQSAEALEIARQYGWRGGAQDELLDMMKDTSKRYGSAIPQEAVAQLMDPAMRFGTSSRLEVEDSLRRMKAAADGANISLEKLAQSAIPAAQALAKEYGMPGRTGLALATGYALESGGREVGEVANKRNILMAAAQKGSLYKALSGDPGDIVRAGASVLGPLADPGYWKQIKDDPRQRGAALEELSWMYMKDPSLLGGLGPEEYMNQMLAYGQGGTGPGDITSAQWQIGKAVTADDYSETGLRAALETGGVSQDVIGGVIEAARTGKTGNREVQEAISKLELGTVSGEQDIEALALHMLKADVESARAGAAKETQALIGIQAPYDQIFDVMIKDAGLGKDKSNQKKWYARAASGAGTGARIGAMAGPLAPVAAPAGGLIGGAAGGIASLFD